MEVLGVIAFLAVIGLFLSYQLRKEEEEDQ